MKVKIPGQKIRQIRESLGLSVPQFASVLAVHAGTVHRWEAAGEQFVPVDGVAAAVIAALNDRMTPSGQFKPQEVGEQIAQALLVGGALVALALLLNAIFKQK